MQFEQLSLQSVKIMSKISYFTMPIWKLIGNFGLEKLSLQSVKIMSKISYFMMPIWKLIGNLGLENVIKRRWTKNSISLRSLEQMVTK